MQGPWRSMSMSSLSQSQCWLCFTDIYKQINVCMHAWSQQQQLPNVPFQVILEPPHHDTSGGRCRNRAGKRSPIDPGHYVYSLLPTNIRRWSSQRGPTTRHRHRHRPRRLSSMTGLDSHTADTLFNETRYRYLTTESMIWPCWKTEIKF